MKITAILCILLAPILIFSQDLKATFLKDKINCSSCNTIEVCYEISMKNSATVSVEMSYQMSQAQKFLDFNSETFIHDTPGTFCVDIPVMNTSAGTNSLTLSSTDNNIVITPFNQVDVEYFPSNSNDIVFNFLNDTIVIDSSNYASAQLCYEIINNDNLQFSGSLINTSSVEDQFVQLVSPGDANVESGVYCEEVQFNFDSIIGSPLSNTFNLSTISPNVTTGQNASMTFVGSVYPQLDNDPEFLIMGFDNNVNDGFKLSLITQKEIDGSTINFTNANYDRISGWSPRHGSEIEFVSIEFDTLIDPYSVICVERDKLSPDPSNAFTITIDGELISSYTIVANITSDFLTPSWSNIYLYQGRFRDDYTFRGNLLDGITYGITSVDYDADIPFTDPNYQLFFLDKDQAGFAFFDCSAIDDICDLLLYIKDPKEWYSDFSGQKDDLEFFQICQLQCNPNACNENTFSFEQNCLQNKGFDILYLVDESASISSEEWDLMLHSIESTSEQFECLNELNRYAISTWSAPRSNSNLYDFEIDFNFQDFNFQNISISQSGGGTNIEQAYSDLINNLESGEFNLNESNELMIILLTDYKSSQTIQPYLYSNLLKQEHSNYNLVVYYGDPSGTEYIAAVASKGGEYNGLVYDNINDPEGTGSPRYFYPYLNFETNLEDIIDTYSSCNSMKLYGEDFSKIQSVDYTSHNGGQIDSISGDSILYFSGSGLYCVDILTRDNCFYNICSEVDFIDQNCGSEIRSRSSNTSQKVHIPRPENGIQLISNPSNIKLFPIPADDAISIIDLENQPIKTVSIFNINGKAIDKLINKEETNSISYSTKGLSSGIYIAKINDQTIVKFIVAH